MKTKLIDLRPIKSRVIRWPDPVRSLVLSEPDRMPVEEFIVKIGTWERLLKIHEVK